MRLGAGAVELARPGTCGVRVAELARSNVGIGAGGARATARGRAPAAFPVLTDGGAPSSGAKAIAGEHRCGDVAIGIF